MEVQGNLFDARRHVAVLMLGYALWHELRGEWYSARKSAQLANDVWAAVNGR